MIGCAPMNRRRFLAASIATIAAPLATHAQQAGKVHRIAVLSPATPTAVMTASGSANWRAFFQELRRLGYIEGQNLVVDRRSAEGEPRRLRALARDIVELKPQVIFASD